MRYIEGQANVLVDTLSQCPNYEPVEIPLVQGTDVSHMAIDVLLEDCFEALSRGCPVAEQRCPSCQIALPYEATRHPGHYRQESKTKCTACGAEVKYQGFTPHWAVSSLSCGM